MNGLVMGAIYALSAAGVSLVAGVMRVINFSHGEFYILGAYFSYYFSVSLGLNPVLAAVVAMGFLFLIGLFIERTLIRSTYGQPMQSMIITFILSIVLQNIALISFGPYPKKPPAFSEDSVHFIGDFNYGIQRLIAGSSSLFLFCLFYLFIKKTRFGLKIRAVAQDPQMAEAVGIHSKRIRLVSFGLAVALAGAAGVVLSPTFPVVPTSGEPLTLSAFVVIVFGGMGSIRGCLMGGLLLGLAENFGSAYISTMYSQVFGFILLIGIILFRPTGIYGNKI